jgi:hypothetical protein
VLPRPAQFQEGRFPAPLQLRGNESVVRIHSIELTLGGSVPDTWVTVYTEDMGNTFGPKGFARGSSLQVSSSKYPRS